MKCTDNDKNKLKNKKPFKGHAPLMPQGTNTRRVLPFFTVGACVGMGVGRGLGSFEGAGTGINDGAGIGSLEGFGVGARVSHNDPSPALPPVLPVMYKLDMPMLVISVAISPHMALFRLRNRKEKYAKIK